MYMYIYTYIYNIYIYIRHRARGTKWSVWADARNSIHDPVLELASLCPCSCLCQCLCHCLCQSPFRDPRPSACRP